MTNHPYYKKFLQHRLNANHRKIPFLFTFETWIKMWEDSGKLHLRGQGKDSYCMARHNDVGPYSPDNVSIETNLKNNTDGGLKRNHDIWYEQTVKVRKSNEWRESISGKGNGFFKGAVVGTNKITGETITLVGKNAINAAGFYHQHVYKCLNGKLKSHGGYTWVRQLP
jgi:hypothetical protein